jgi:hypothetical protein
MSQGSTSQLGENLNEGEDMNQRTTHESGHDFNRAEDAAKKFGA